MEPRFTAKFGVVRGTHLGAKRVAQVVHNPNPQRNSSASSPLNFAISRFSTKIPILQYLVNQAILKLI